MAAITPTLIFTLPHPGGTKIMRAFTAAVGSASDTVDLSTWFSTLNFAIYVITAGQAAGLLAGHVVTVSGTTATIVGQEQDGTVSSAWSGVAGILIAFGDQDTN